ncbi:MAG: hypothetical protein RL077_1078 [Verrucomicrobiota bacterium]|jgi:ABC-type polar amino acid transport system ATPase subunit
MDATPIISPPRIEVRGLELNYGPTPVLKGINLAVRAGEVVACLGRSGCGKTSLLKSLTLFVRPQGGKIAIDGQNICVDGKVLVDARKHRERVCLVFQDHSLFPNLTGLENIVFGYIRRKQIGRKAGEDEAIELAKQFGLTSELLSRYPQSYSSGQQQRVCLVRALILRPEVLILDEPTSALDPESIVSVIEAIQRLREESVAKGLSVVMVTHLAKFAEEISDRIAFLHDGIIVEDKPARRFFAEASHPSVEAFAKRFRYAM